jgi:hypothetical protein
MIDDSEDETGTKAVCEYGVTIVDAVTGAVTMGQFADDVLRSRMQTLLASFGPSEVSIQWDAVFFLHFFVLSVLKNAVISCSYRSSTKEAQMVHPGR